MNDVATTFPIVDNSRDSECIHQVFAARAQETPDTLAVTCEGRSLTYRELNTRSNQLARYLQTLGVEPEVPVAIYLERSLDMIVGMLGILKAGGAYVPLDPTYPQERIGFMLEDSQAEVLLTQEKLLSNLPQHRAQIICLDDDWAEITRSSVEDPGTAVTESNLAYVIYTSGSTGRPKGVGVNHATVIHLFECFNSSLGVRRSDVWTVSHSYAFDLSVWEIFGALLSGGRLVIVPLRVTQSPRQFYNLLRAEKVTVLSLTPSALRQLVDFVSPQTEVNKELSLRLLIAGGDVFPSDLAVLLVEWNVPLWNFYGPTESTVWATFRKVEATDVQYNSVPVGKPIPGIETYIVDEDMQPVPNGVAGELLLGGAGLARGYFRRPALTAERFVPNPFADVPGARVYETGDLVRILSNGNIEHLGRIDHQVKVRGFRIELEEIEAVFTQDPAVRQCIVLAREDQPGEKRLVAYLVPNPGHTPNVSKLLSAAKAKLPEYMVPTAFVLMQELPLTVNKKVDRSSLPPPDQTRPALTQEYVAPRNQTEKLLADIWAAVLCIDRVGIHDSFFELGGHSLLATKVISRVRDTFHADLPLSEIFEHPTLDQLAAVIDDADKSATGLPTPSIPRASRDEYLPLSFPQERVWFIQQLFPETLAYNFQSTLRFRGALDCKVLERSLDEIVRRHEIFRTTFPAIDGRPRQEIHKPWRVRLDVVDLMSLPEPERSQALENHISRELQQHFDLTKLPLIRWTLLRIAEQEHVLLHVEHHLVHDGWSFNIFLAELLNLYRAFAEGKPSPLPELPVQFADFAVWQRQWMQGDVARAQLNYWRETLAGSPEVLEIQTDHQRPAVQSLRGTSKRMELPLDLCHALRKFSRENGVTLYMTMFAAFQVLLHRLSAQNDFRVGSAIANRRWPETESMIGMLVNTIAFRANFSDKPSFLELLNRVRRSTLEAYTHQDLPFEMLVDALQRDRDLSRNPLFQVMFNFHDAPLPELNLPGVTTDLVEVISNQSAKFDFNLILVPRTEQRLGWSPQAKSGGITEIWEYNTDLFDEDTILRFERLYRSLLKGMLADPNRPVAHLPLLPVAERERLLTQWQGPRIPSLLRSSIHELFESQVERTPQNVALVFKEEQLTYRELNLRSNRLAHHLRRHGVGPGTVVAICLERSVEMIVGLLGILKAGGAYLPLDASYPHERLAFMLADGKAKVLLMREHLRERLPAKGITTIFIDKDWEAVARESADNPDSLATADNLAYVMYTSGSTGKPKGVAITHRSVVRLVKETNYVQIGPDDVFLQFATLSFDASTFEIWGSLLNGCRLVVMPPELISLANLGDTLKQQSVTTLWLTAGLFQQMVETELESLRGLRQLLAGGDALPVRHVELVARELKGCQLINGYGPTENTTFTCCYRVKSEERFAGSVPIGFAISNTQAYILDDEMEPVPIGVVGELYTGGAGLALGYLNDPALTAERFLPDPFSQEPGARLYRTADRGRYRTDGSIEFLGRVDHQVKLRGYRIELGEIETLVRRYPGVSDCAVVVNESGGDKRLIAYVIMENGPEGDAKALRAFLQTQLPAYMLPAQIVWLARMPLTLSGKIDRGALPPPDLSKLDSQETFVGPRNPVEQKLAEIWAPLLHRDQIGVHDNFFVLGGHSLLATQAVSRIRDAFGVELTVGTFFSSPTVSQLAEAVNNARACGNASPVPAIVPIPRGQPQSERLP